MRDSGLSDDFDDFIALRLWPYAMYIHLDKSNLQCVDSVVKE